MLHAIRALLRERRCNVPACFRRNRCIGGAEIAHVQFVQHDVLGRGQSRFRQGLPTARLEILIIERDDVAAGAVACQRDRVRIGDHIGLDLVGAANENLRFVQIELAVEAAAAVAPDAARGIERHRVSRVIRAIRVGEHAHLHVARGRRPHAQRGLSLLEAGSQRERPCLGRVQVVEYAGYLQPGSIDALACAHGADRQLTFQALRGSRDRLGRQLECREVRKMREARLERGRRVPPGRAPASRNVSSALRRCRDHRA